MSKIVFFTIVLDGMPWITLHYPVMRRLPFEWEWHVMEGVAAPEHDTAWCKRMDPRLSNDGTTKYLQSMAHDDRVKLYRSKEWRGKIEMVNTPLQSIKEPCLLWEIDSDEIWTEIQIEKVRRMFLQCPSKTEAMFYCRYFVGPDIVTVGKNCYGNNDYEWRRVWRFKPGMKFKTHEPPIMVGGPTDGFTREETLAAGIVFDHFAYATESTVALKRAYYGANSGLYNNAVEDWKRLQANKEWPVNRLKDFLPWVDDRVGAVRI